MDTLDEEFEPLPAYHWLERPLTVPLTAEEAATSIYLSHGELESAADRLRVPLHRLTRLLRSSPRLQLVWREALEHVLVRARRVPIATLFDPEADARRLEWAAARVLNSRLAANDLLAPAPSTSVSTSVSVGSQLLTVRWGDGTKIAELGSPDAAGRDFEASDETGGGPPLLDGEAN